MPDVVPVRDDAVRLERWRADHVDGLVAAMLASADELRTWFAWAAVSPTRAAQLERLATVAPYEYVLVDGDDDEVIGSVRVNPMGDVAGIGYWLRSDRVGGGVMTAAVRAVGETAFAFLGVDELEIQCDAANERSAAIPRRLGYALVDEIDRPIEAPGHTGRGLVWRRRKA